jgi:hypothetical protein
MAPTWLHFDAFLVNMLLEPHQQQQGILLKKKKNTG